MIVIILLLLASQLYLYYIYYDKIKKYKDIKKESIILEPIPKKPYLDDIENEILLNEVITSCRDENWECKIDETITPLNCLYKIDIKSNDGLIEIKASIRTYSTNGPNGIITPRLTTLRICSNENSVLFDSDSKFKNHILIFLWDYIIKYKLNQNSEIIEKHKKNIEAIRKNLISLNRNKILDQIL